MANLILDFDGTIADSFEMVVETTYKLSGSDRQLTPKEVARLRGLSMSEIIKDLHIKPWRLPYMLFVGRHLVGRRLASIGSFSGMPETLRKLHAEGHRMFIVSSNTRKNIQAFLQQHHLQKEFIKIYGNAGVLSKTRSLKKVLRQNDLKIEDCWYVGDTTVDIASAQAIGMRVIAVSWGYNTPEALRQHNPDKLLETPAVLFDVLEEA